MKRALVTGATGFLGRNLADFLQNRGVEMVCMVRKTSRHEFLLNRPGIEVVFGDFCDDAAMRRCVKGVDVVFHLAGCISALTPERMMEVNRDFTENLVKICVESPTPPTFVYVSSLAAAGISEPLRPHVEGDLPMPISPYGRSKLAGEQMLRTYAGRMPISVVRPPMIFGPHDQEMRKWMDTLRRSRVFFVPALRPYRMSLVHSEDVCDLLLRVGDSGERMTPDGFPGVGVYYVSQTEHLTYVELGKRVGNALGLSRFFVIPASPPILTTVGAMMDVWGKWRGRPCSLNGDKVRESLAGSWSCSSEKARRQLGFRNLHTLDEQLKDIV